MVFFSCILPWAADARILPKPETGARHET